MAVGNIPDHKGHLTAAVLEVCVCMKDMESQRKWSGFLWLTIHPQRCDHNVSHVSEEGLDPSLYDLGLEWF